MVALSIGLTAMIAVGAANDPAVASPRPVAASELPAARPFTVVGRTYEVDLGTFRVSVPLSDDHAILLVDFQLYGTVPVRDKKQLESLLSGRTLRLRQAVVLAVRETTTEELADPRLTSLLNRIQQAANDALGQPLLQRVGLYQLDYVAE